MCPVSLKSHPSRLPVNLCTSPYHLTSISPPIPSPILPLYPLLHHHSNPLFPSPSFYDLSLLHPSLSLLRLSLSASLHLSLHPSLSLLCLSLSASLHLFIHPFLSLSLHSFLHLSLHPSLSLLHLSLSASLHLSLHPSLSLSTPSSISPFILPSLSPLLPPSLPSSFPLSPPLHPFPPSLPLHPSSLSGCPMIIKLGGREEHEKDCEYAPVQCPNSSNCSVVLKKDLTEHLLKCKHVRCPHHRYKYVLTSVDPFFLLLTPPQPAVSPPPLPLPAIDP